ncbi:hypothetical protein BU17DRAFT_62430 [Hysterangium stoloniferum]|nr:hypothetical protein BU17DRAFT_62430 [Hysterangium stoloniferum]
MAESGIPPSVLQTIFMQVRNTQVSRFNELALDSLYLYDYSGYSVLPQRQLKIYLSRQSVTTLDQEVELIWIRYIPLFSGVISKRRTEPNPFIMSVHKFVTTSEWMTSEQSSISRSTLVQIPKRIGYNSSRIHPDSTLMGISVTQGLALSEPGPGFFVCDLVPPRYFAAYWLPILAFESTLVVLTVAKGWKSMRSNRISIMSGMSGRELLDILVRDSVIYFVLITVVYAANAAVWQWADPSLWEASSVYGLNVPPIAASKLLFSLRSNSKKAGSVHTNAELEMGTFGRSGYTQSIPSWRVQTQWDEWGQRGGSTTVLPIEAASNSK